MSPVPFFFDQAVELVCGELVINGATRSRFLPFGRGDTLNGDYEEKDLISYFSE